MSDLKQNNIIEYQHNELNKRISSCNKKSFKGQKQTRQGQKKNMNYEHMYGKGLASKYKNTNC